MATYPKYWPKVGWFLGLKHTQYDEISSMKIPSTLSTKSPVCPARRDFAVDANTGTLSNRSSKVTTRMWPSWQTWG